MKPDAILFLLFIVILGILLYEFIKWIGKQE